MYKDLKDKVVIITGGAGHIGIATAKAFLQEESKIIVVDKNEDNLKNFKKDFDKSALSILVDLSRSDEVKKMVEDIKKQFNKIDILVNLAGNAFGNDIHKIDDSLYWKDINTNLTQTFFCTREVLPHMISNHYGAIINISSVNSILGIGEAAYSAAKAGINSLTQNTAVRYGRYGIRCNCLCLGTIKTDSPNWQRRLVKDPKVLDKISTKIPRKKVGEPEEVATCILFLASNASNLLNGAIIIADGGWTIAAGTVKENEGNWWES